MDDSEKQRNKMAVMLEQFHDKYAEILITIAITVFLSLIILVPRTLSAIKMIPLAVLCLIAVYRILILKQKPYNKMINIWFVIFLVYNSIWSVIGIVNHNVGAMSYARLGIFFTIAYFLVFSLLNDKIHLLIRRLFILFTLIISLFTIYTLMVGLDWLPNLFSWLNTDSRVGIHYGYAHTIHQSVGMLVFLLPYSIAAFITNKDKFTVINGIAGVMFWSIVMLAIVSTSRRMIYFLIPITFFGILLSLFFIKDKAARKTILCKMVVYGAVIGLLFVGSSSLIKFVTSNKVESLYMQAVKTDTKLVDILTDLDEKQTGTGSYPMYIVLDVPPQAVQDWLMNKYTGGTVTEKPELTGAEDPASSRINPFDPDTNGDIRQQQIQCCLEGFKKNPIMGVGFGAIIPGYLDGTKWIIEIEYIARLYQTGIVGMIILLFCLISFSIYGMKFVKKSIYGYFTFIPPLVAYVCALFSTGSNPYIFSGFDFLFMLFYPLAVVALMAKKQKQETIEDENNHCLSE